MPFGERLFDLGVAPVRAQRLFDIGGEKIRERLPVLRPEHLIADRHHAVIFEHGGNDRPSEALLNAPNLLLKLMPPHHLNNVTRRCARAHLLGTMFRALPILIAYQMAVLVLLAAAATARLISSELSHKRSVGCHLAICRFGVGEVAALLICHRRAFASTRRPWSVILTVATQSCASPRPRAPRSRPRSHARASRLRCILPGRSPRAVRARGYGRA